MTHNPIHLALVVEQLFQSVPGGSGRYIEELVKAFSRKDVAAAGIAATMRGQIGSLPIVPTRIARPLLYRLWNQVGYPKAEHIVAHPDIVHATTWAIPPTDAPLVVTIHDVAFLESPEHFTKRGVKFFHRALERAKKEADRIIVPSIVTAQECLQAGLSEDIIRVIPHGVSLPKISDTYLAQFRSKYALPQDYIFWCGTFEPRKNLQGLLAAWSINADKLPDLVLAGPKGWGDTSLEVPASQLHRVHFVGRLSEPDLAAAYRAATVFAFPSFKEGFGLPVLEALSVGTPVVTTKNSSMQEITGSKAGVLVDATDPEDISNGLLTALENHDSLSQLTKTRASEFTWHNAAAQHVKVYEELL